MYNDLLNCVIMNEPKISVIMAVYNAATVMEKGIDSVLAQTYKNFEVILVDDGSTDATAGICDKYSHGDKRVRVFHETHRGVAHSRQVGVDNAHGKYTIHVDADDVIAPDMFFEMVNIAEKNNADMVICDFYEVTETEKTLKCQKSSNLKPSTLVNEMMCGRLFGSLWNKLIRTDCYKQYGVKFHQELNVREDIVAVCDLLQYINRIEYIPKAFYYYKKVCGSGSLTHSYNNDDREHYMQEIGWHKAFLNNRLINDEMKCELQKGVAGLSYTTLRKDLLRKDEWDKCFLPLRQLLLDNLCGYKKMLVKMAIEGKFVVASQMRTIISKIRN